MRQSIILKTVGLILALLIVIPARSADLMAGLAAYERQDYQTALVQLMQLAEAGNADAQFILGRMFGRGEGVVQDYVEAHKWYNLAASRGQRLAAPARDAVAQQMTPEQIARAQELARDWRPLGGAAVARAPLETSPETDPAFSALPAVAPPNDELSDASDEPSDTVSPVTVLSQPQNESPESAEPSETLVASIQLELKRLGYPIRSVDGKLGEQTLEAIRSYQASKGLEVTGMASPRLLQHLQAQQGAQPRIQRSPPAQIRERPLADWQRLL